MVTITLLLLMALTISALWSVLKRDMVKAAIGLALTSIILTILMFRFAAPLAAVFELSVCAGLITVIFMSTISLTKPTTAQEEEHLQTRAEHFTALPVLVAAAAAVLAVIKIPMNFTLPQPVSVGDVRSVLWSARQIDLIGQILAILAGFFGVLVLFKERLRSTGRAAAKWMQAFPALGVASGKQVGSVETSGGDEELATTNSAKDRS